MFVVFEGIDGSGKTTLSGKVAAALAEHGVTVHQARPKGELKSKLAGSIRTLARDPRSLTMSPHTELLLYLARDSQMIDTVIRPALDRADVVIADRYVYSPLVLCKARGLVPPEQVEQAVGVVARGLWPDLVVYCDVDIHTSNLRKKIDKQVKLRDPHDFGRKGLAGLGLRDAMRDQYLELAAAGGDGWLVVDNARGTVEENAGRIVDRILELLGREPAARTGAVQTRIALDDRACGVGDDELARARFYDYLTRLADDGQRRLAAYHLRSIESTEAWELRHRLAADEPEVIALGLEPLGSPAAITLRRELLERAPRQVARSLGASWADERPDAFELRRELAEAAPVDVALTLGTLDSEPAWELRERLAERSDLAAAAVLASLKRLDSARAWALRERLGGKKTDWGLLEGLAGLDHDRAWALRHRYRKRALPWVILGLAGCDSAAAWELREQHFERATKLVVRSLGELSNQAAWALRRRAGEWCKESLTTIKNADETPAWELRDALAERWPEFAGKSVGMTLAQTERGIAFLWRLVANQPDNPLVLHYLVKALEVKRNA